MRAPRSEFSLVGVLLMGCSLDRGGIGVESDGTVETGDAGDADTYSPCSDGVVGGDETDIDCGGSTCGKCGDGKQCKAPTDCVSGTCSGGRCLPKASCSNLTLDGDESDVDCGGSCGKCSVGKKCGKPSDCATGVCTAGFCGSAGCKDGSRNGDETDVDCGGSCSPCVDGKECIKGKDCVSSFCDVTTCRLPRSCKAIHASDATQPSGVYRIDPDGTGPIEPFDVYCDMKTDGGGWTFFAHVNEDYAGSNLFETNVGDYRTDRADLGTYSRAGWLLPTLSHTAMYVALDKPDADVAAATSKLLFMRYASAAPAFNKGPLPCVGPLDAFTYRVGLTGAFAAGATNGCTTAHWYLRNTDNSAFLVVFDAAPAGHLWGKGMGGDDSIAHDGYWFVR